MSERPEVVLADAGYWSNDHIDSLRERGMIPIVAPDTTRNRPRKTRLGGPYDFMRRVLATERGGELYSRRLGMVEPVFGQIKANRRIGRFKRRGRAAARSEWRLIAATHNLLKLHRHTLADRSRLSRGRTAPVVFRSGPVHRGKGPLRPAFARHPHAIAKARGISQGTPAPSSGTSVVASPARARRAARPSSARPVRRLQEAQHLGREQVGGGVHCSVSLPRHDRDTAARQSPPQRLAGRPERFAAVAALEI